MLIGAEMSAMTGRGWQTIVDRARDINLDLSQLKMSIGRADLEAVYLNVTAIVLAAIEIRTIVEWDNGLLKRTSTVLGEKPQFSIKEMNTWLGEQNPPVRQELQP